MEDKQAFCELFKRRFDLEIMAQKEILYIPAETTRFLFLAWEDMMEELGFLENMSYKIPKLGPSPACRWTDREKTSSKPSEEL